MKKNNMQVRTLARNAREIGSPLLSAIMASDLLSSEEKSVYQIIFTHGPLTRKEVARHSTSSGSLLTRMTAKGVIVADAEVHDANIGRRVKTWRISGQMPVKFKRARRVPYPTANELKVFARHLHVLSVAAARSGARVSPPVKKVMNWLANGAPCKHVVLNKTSTKRIR
jgi:hypothetical protein